jgi:hypothetical protein
MSDDPRKLELREVFQADAAEIVAARDKAVLIHHSGDIDAAGDEVEQAVRSVFRRKLPVAYHIGHGHIVDAKWHTSPQLDIVLADNAGAPILFRGKNGTEYFPYESVFAVGEVKSAYYKHTEPVHAFTETLRRIKHDLNRTKTPPEYVSEAFTFGPGFRVDVDRPYKNPLFSFMLFVQANDFDVEHIVDLYASKPADELPNVVCFLDKGTLVNVGGPDLGAGRAGWPLYNLHPEFNKPQQGWANRWAFLPLGLPDAVLGGNFAFLYFALGTHLRSCILMPPNLLAYLSETFSPHDVFLAKVFG